METVNTNTVVNVKTFTATESTERDQRDGGINTKSRLQTFDRLALATSRNLQNNKCCKISLNMLSPGSGDLTVRFYCNKGSDFPGDTNRSNRYDPGIYTKTETLSRPAA